MNEHDEDYAFEIARQRRIDKGEPDGDPYEERKLREKEEEEDDENDKFGVPV